MSQATSIPPRSPSGARVRASTVLLRETWAVQQHGASARQRFRAAASPALRSLLHGVLAPPQGWVEFDLFIEATSLAGRLFGRDDLAAAWDIGRFAATHDAGVWKNLFLRHVSPALLIGVAGGIWGQHYEGGRLASRSFGDQGLLVTLSDFPRPHRTHCLSIGGWIQGSLEAGPRRSVAVKESSCRALGAATCEFAVSWA